MYYFFKNIVNKAIEVKIFYWILAIVFLFAAICLAKIKSIDVPTSHIDGAFQTASSLFRLLGGELPGRDFYPYLGIGPVALIYPGFFLSGASLCASVFSSHFTLYLANIFSLSIIIHFLCKPKRFLTSLTIACALFSLFPLLNLGSSPFINMINIPAWLDPMLTPGNSLRPLRGAIPYFVAGMLYFFILPEKNLTKKIIYYGLSLGITSIWSNDYALSTMFLLVLLTFPSFVKDPNLSFLKTVIIFLTTSILSVILIQLLLTGGGALKLIQYNFFNVAVDQWWYFGPWQISSRIFSFNDWRLLLPEMAYPFSCYLFGALFFGCIFFKKNRIEFFLVLMIGILLLAGGGVASVGGHVGGYFDNFIYWLHAVFLTIGCKIAYELFLLLFRGKGQKIVYLVAMMFCFSLVMANAFYANKWLYDLRMARKDPIYFYVDELGGYLNKPAWESYINYIRAHKEETVIEEYFGIWSAMRKQHSIWPVDSVIHALGEVRITAVQALKDKAQIVVSSNELTGQGWLGWNISANYWFYKTLFETYTPVYYSPTTIVWEKSKPREDAKSIPCSINDTKDKILLSKTHSGYYEVELVTKTKKMTNNRFLKMFQNDINFAMFETGMISTSITDDILVAPVYVSDQEVNEFGFEVRPAGSAQVLIESCKVKEILLKDHHVLSMSEGLEKIYAKNQSLTTVYSDPVFWDRGISTKVAGFYVYKNKKSINSFKPGSAVQLPTGDIRIVTSVGGADRYLEVYLTGRKLNPDTIGFPSNFKSLQGDKLQKFVNSLKDEIFITDNISWVKGIGIMTANFIVANTEKNRQLYVRGKRVQIPNTDERTIIDVEARETYLLISVTGPVLDVNKVGLPNHFKISDESIIVPTPAPAMLNSHDKVTSDRVTVKPIADDFFLSDSNWLNGVSIHLAAFFVANTEQNRKLYTIGRRVRIPNTSDRVINGVNPNGKYLEVYVTGSPMVGPEVGLPSGFKVLTDD